MLQLKGPMFWSIVGTNEKRHCFQAFSNILAFQIFFSSFFGFKKKKIHVLMDRDATQYGFPRLTATATDTTISIHASIVLFFTPLSQIRIPLCFIHFQPKKNKINELPKNNWSSYKKVTFLFHSISLQFSTAFKFLLLFQFF